MAIFADGHDRQTSLRYMAEEAERCGGTFLGWCMMTNHVHLIAVPEREDSLARAIGIAQSGGVQTQGAAGPIRQTGQEVKGATIHRRINYFCASMKRRTEDVGKTRK